MPRRTKQKQTIQTEIDKIDTFFTAEELFKRVKKNNPRIGIATIYRYLREMRNQRQLHSYICSRKTVYSKNQNNHCHFHCQRCKTTTHFEITNIDFLKKRLKANICHFQIDIHGICSNCKPKDI